ncbi:MAG: AI-2E family transporter [Acidobacteria bacterium]|nr:MAG: AI-2E family transporter [Acidobacteriota bacterium]
MEKSTGNRGAMAASVVTLAVLAVLFAMREAQAIVVPTLMAFFLAVVAESPVAWLEKKGLPRVLSILLVVTGLAVALFVIGLVLGSSVQDLSRRVPEYQERLQDQIDSLLAGAGETGIGADAAGILDKLSPETALSLASGFLSGVSDLFSNAFLIFFIMVFMLLEVPSFSAKLEALGGSMGTWLSIGGSVRSYLAIKTLTSLATGVLVAIFLALVGIDFAVLWGLLAFLLNFVPNIGSILAAVPAVLMALLLNGLPSALLVAGGYVVINVLIGNVVEPRIMGEGLGLSTLVVFLSLILWGWLLGPVGMLLSVPLTTTLKIVLESRESTRPMAVLLGSGPASGNESP